MTSRPAVILTAFEPFGGKTENNALRVLTGLRDSMALADNADLQFLVLPVAAGEPSRIMESVLSSSRCDYILSLGEAGRPGISMERVASNRRKYRIPDNRGNQPDDDPIHPGGPPSYRATFPYEPILRAAENSGVDPWYSDDAGGFLCNELLYTTLHLVARFGYSYKAGFIHVPAGYESPEDDATDRIVQALESGLVAILTA